MNNKKNIEQAGFSLLELAIVVTIIAVIVSTVASSGKKASDSIKLKATRSKIIIIKESIAYFVKMNKRLPCPTNATLKETHINFGQEDCAGNLTFDVSGNLPTGFIGSDNRVIAGAVPFAALNIPMNYTKDAYNNRFTYVVTKSLTNSKNDFLSTNMGLITIRDRNGINVTNKAALLILSHGENGFGAWNSSGTRNVASSNIGEIENSHVGGVWDNIFILNNNPFRGFEDIAEYSTKSQIINLAQINIANQACMDSENILNKTADYYCKNPARQSPASSQCKIILDNFANQINNWCN